MNYDIFFDHETHTYLVDGKETPSVTEILSPLHRSYSSISQTVLAQAANRGTAVHEALEEYDLNGYVDVPIEYGGYIRAYLDWQSVYLPTWIGVEEIVYHENLGYAGTLDRIGFLNRNELAVVDLKTSQPIKEALVSVCLQTYAYAEAWQRMNDKQYDITRYGLFLKADGTWRFQNCAEYEKKYNFDSADVFYGLLKMRQMIDNLLATGADNGKD